jgi:hypothetical protein
MTQILEKLATAEHAAIALVKALESVYPGIAIARQNVNELKIMFTTAKEAHSKAAMAEEQIRVAYVEAEHDEQSILDAHTAAQSATKAAKSSKDLAKDTLRAATEALQAAESPIQHILKIPEQLRHISRGSDDGAIAKRVKKVLDTVTKEYAAQSSANTHVASAHRAVSEAESRVQQASSKLRKLEQIVKPLREAHRLSPTEATANLLSQKEAELSRDKHFHGEAEIDLVGAKSELSHVIKSAPVVLAAHELLISLEALWTEADKCDQAFAQAARDQARREAEQAARFMRRADTCTCTCTEGDQCSSCRLKELMRHNGQSRDPNEEPDRTR